MATQSIMKNITITEPTAAETSCHHYIESEDLSKEELKKFSGRIQ